MSSPSSALISGAGTGIGLACAEKFIAEGWRVIATGRRAEPLEALRKRFPSAVLPIACDLTDAGMVRSLVKTIGESEFGRLGAIVNNAGIFERRSFRESGDELWQAMFETHLLAPVRLCRLLLPALESNRGSIVNVSSTLGLKPVPLTSAYSALKAAMINWTEALALEAAPAGVRVNCVCPGIVDTPIHAFHANSPAEKAAQLGRLQPLGRIGRPTDVAHAVWSLCGPGSEWITGSILKVDGGIHLV